jgi:tetratricopeptide (TPR) repeat protein
MNTTRTLRNAVLALAVAAVSMAADEGYSKYSRQKELARQGEQAESRGRFGVAAKAYRKSRLYAIDNRTRAQLVLREAECWSQDSAPYKAFEAYKTLLESYPLYVPYDRVLPRLRQLAGDFERGTGSWFGFRSRSKAIAVYELILQETPVGSGAITDSLNLGGLLTADHRPEEAIVVYREALKRFPADPVAPQLRLELGRLLADDSRTGDGDGRVAREAVRELNSFIASKPDDPRGKDAQFLLSLINARRADALYDLARFYLRPAHRREPAARRYLGDLVRDYTGTTAASRAAVQLAALGPAPIEPEAPVETTQTTAVAAALPDAAPDAAKPAKAKAPPRRLLGGLLPGGRADPGQPRTFRTLKEREDVEKWLLPLGDVNELKAGGGSQ